MSTYIPDDKIAEIKDSFNIVHLIAEYVPLKKYGANYRGLCPFHSENTPSFTVSEAKQIFHCFGCNTGGNIFTFLMKFEHLSFPEAAQKLARKAGIELPQKESSPAQQRLEEEKGKFLRINELATSYYSTCLRTRSAEKARIYLTQRNISEETITEYRLGCALPLWDGLLTFLKKQGASLELAQRVGLLKYGKNNTLYDSFRNRIIFPIINYNQRVIGFSSRALEEDGAKYINSSDSLIYKKSNSLYGLNVALPFIRKEDSVILVEGNFDLLSLHHHGIKNVVATLGTALTDGQVKLLKRFTRNITISFDTDAAGIKATLKSLPLFLENEISPKILLLPDGCDPDAYIHREKADEFRKKLNQSIPLMEFFISRVVSNNDRSTINGSLKIIREIAPRLLLLRDATERNLYIQKLSHTINVSEQVIRTELHAERPKKSNAPEGPIKAPQPHRAEELLLQAMILHPEAIAQVKQAEIADDLKEPYLKRLLLFIIACFDANRSISPDWLINNLDEEPLKNIVSAQSIKGAAIIDVPKTVQNCIQNIKTASLKREIQLLNTKIKEAEQDKDEKAIKQYLVDKQKLLERKKGYAPDHLSIHLQ